MKTLTASLVTLMLAAAPAQAQQTDDRLLRGTTVAVTVAGWFVDDEAGLGALQLHAGKLEPRRATFEFDVALILDQGAGVFPDLGVAYNVAQPGFTILPRAGVGVAAIVGIGGGIVLPGYYVGSGLVAHLGPGVGLRLDVAAHWYLVEGRAVSAISFGAGLASLHPGG